MNWKLTRDPAGRLEVDVMGNEHQAWGVSVLAELARTDPGMHRHSEGRYIVDKRPGREF